METFFWIGGPGLTVVDTRKFRNVGAGNNKVALLIDDMVLRSIHARGIRIYGHSEQPFKRVGMVGPGHVLAHHPTISCS